MHLFNRRLGAYQQLKDAVEPVRASGAVSNSDGDRFARAMSDIQFLFDKEVEQFVGDVYDALLRKHALDALLEKAFRRIPLATKLSQKGLFRKARNSLVKSPMPFIGICR